MSSSKRIAIIGAGPCGLTSIKACKEENVEPVCFERNGDPGGLWRYRDEDVEGVASVMKTTIINTSKEMSAFSDFPPPKEFPNYMHHSMMYKYFMLYAKKFDVLRHIRCYQEVIKVKQVDDFEETGRWSVTARDSRNGEISEEIFDGVMVCMGHHVYPKIPTFPGQEKFKGKIVHTHSLKNCEAFSDLKVVVVGIGNSGVDVAVDSTFVAKQVYLSTRRGSWIFSRVGDNGLPGDMFLSNRFKLLLSSLKSYDAICSEVEERVQKKFDHEAYNLKPKHRILSAHPTVNDALPNMILSGKVVVKGNIDRFEENGVVFEGENDVTEVDVVVLATGYHIKFPFLDDNIVQTKENRVQLYKYCIPPNLKHPTLAIVALFQPIGSIFPLGEMQIRWYMQVFTKKLQLPSKEEMMKDIKMKNEANAKRYVESTRHTIQVDWLPLMDELAEQIGIKPNLLKMSITDPKLFWTCLMEPCLPYQYRLQGPHKWDGARDALLTYKERLYAPLNTRNKNVVIPKRSVSLRYFTDSHVVALFLTALIVMCYWKWDKSLN